MNNSLIIEFAEKPITHLFSEPSKEEIAALHYKSDCVEITEQAGFVIGNDYYQLQLPGSIPRVFCRLSVFERMKKLAAMLLPHYGVYFFDVFRTRETQAYLFNECRVRYQKNHPEWSEEELEAYTRLYVSHPDEPTRFSAPPHNTGAAIDLAIVDLKTQKLVNFGSPIDLSEKISDTDFFETNVDSSFGLSESQWLEARKYRRILFHSMAYLGFTNFPSEWWHYDLGDGMWAQVLGQETVYHSMETEVQAALLTCFAHN